ncbi:protein of unknown function [Kyrpidia spormannii]|uniref:Uncharacterized protein n=1 Tax=Kyrpidia spormannii TaxID=2055160 RepID=A0ACA8Z6H5_9BACL|nr:protein of unknown function [Kyrpidia spormannii]
MDIGPSVHEEAPPREIYTYAIVSEAKGLSISIYALIAIRDVSRV